MIYEFVINNRKLKSGDIISTKYGNNSIYSLGFHLMCALIPGKVDHTVIYVGPEGLCVESGYRGVIAFNASSQWTSERINAERAVVDTFYAASSVFPGRGLTAEAEIDIRNFVRAYVLGSVGKPYNFDLLDPDTEKCVYCSQLAYLAYKKAGINLNVSKPPTVKGFEQILFPENILKNTTLIPDQRTIM